MMPWPVPASRDFDHWYDGMDDRFPDWALNRVLVWPHFGAIPEIAPSTDGAYRRQLEARSLSRWGFDDPWRVAYHRWPNARVSTVFLGYDAAHGLGPPRYFETMITIRGEGEGEYVRHRTYRRALLYHEVLAGELARLYGPCPDWIVNDGRGARLLPAPRQEREDCR